MKGRTNQDGKVQIGNFKPLVCNTPRLPARNVCLSSVVAGIVAKSCCCLKLGRALVNYAQVRSESARKPRSQIAAIFCRKRLCRPPNRNGNTCFPEKSQKVFRNRNSLTLQPLLFGISLLFRCDDFLALLCVFLFLFQGFARFRQRGKPLLFRLFPLLFSKKGRFGGSGLLTNFHRVEQSPGFFLRTATTPTLEKMLQDCRGK